MDGSQKLFILNDIVNTHINCVYTNIILIISHMCLFVLFDVKKHLLCSVGYDGDGAVLKRSRDSFTPLRLRPTTPHHSEQNTSEDSDGVVVGRKFNVCFYLGIIFILQSLRMLCSIL